MAEVARTRSSEGVVQQPHTRTSLITMARPGNEVSKLGIEALPVEPDTPVDIEEKRIVPVTLQPVVVPDGGLRAWLQVFGCWLVFFNVW